MPWLHQLLFAPSFHPHAPRSSLFLSLLNSYGSFNPCANIFLHEHERRRTDQQFLYRAAMFDCLQQQMRISVFSAAGKLTQHTGRTDVSPLKIL
jgi:hypothetical protein